MTQSSLFFPLTIAAEREWSYMSLRLSPFLGAGLFYLELELIPDSLWIFYNMRIPEVFFFETFYAEAGVTIAL